MARAGGRLRILVVGGSAAAHLAAFALLALVRPDLSPGPAPPPPVFQVLIAPRFTPSPAQAQAQASPSRPLRVRRPAQADRRAEVPPLLVPETAIAPPSTPTPPADIPAVPPRLGETLRRGAVGCANPSLLSKEEQEACLERLGAGAKDAPFIEPPMSPDKRRDFDAAAAKKQANRRYREANMPVGVTPTPKPSEAPNPFPEVWSPRP